MTTDLAYGVSSPSRRVLALIALLPLLSLNGCSDSAAPAAAATTTTDASLSVNLVKPQSRALQQRLSASGSIAAQEEILLGVELSGVRVAEVLVDVGANVSKNQVLLRLDTRTLDSDLRQADAAVAEAKAALEVARRNDDRMRALREKGFISARDADEMSGASIQSAARLNSARAQRDAVALRRDFAELRAPAAGVISRRDVQPGQVVSAGGELLRLIRGGQLEWRGALPEAELIRVQEGAAVTLTGPDGSAASGRVRTVGASLDPASRTGTVYATLTEPGKLRAGMFAQGELQLGETTALMLPLAAIVQRDGHSYVFRVATDQRVSRQRISTGRIDGNAIEVTEGLTSSDDVVARGAGFLAEGDRVRVVAGEVAP